MYIKIVGASKVIAQFNSILLDIESGNWNNIPEKYVHKDLNLGNKEIEMIDILSGKFLKMLPDEKKVYFFHGLEGSMKGTKATYLKANFDMHGIDMKVKAIRNNYKTKQELFWACFEMQKRELEKFKKDRFHTVIGSSFGGGLLLEMLKLDTPVLSHSTQIILLAPSIFGRFPKFKGNKNILNYKHLKIVHGTKDDVVKIISSQKLVNAFKLKKKDFIVLDDDHKLKSTVDKGILKNLVEKWDEWNK